VTNATVLDTDTMVTVTVTHTVDGEKDLSKYNDSDKKFTVTLNCGTGYINTVTLIEGDVASYSVPSGSSCTLTTDETQLPMLDSAYYWASHTSTPASPFTVDTDTDTSVTHVIRETSARTLTVTKAVEGSGYLGGTFDITVTCAGKATLLQLADNGMDTVEAHVGDSCTVTEAVPAGVIDTGYTNRATVSPSSFTVADDMTVAVTNTVTMGDITTAMLTVTKTVTGEGHDPLASFDITVTCDGVLSTLNLKAGQSGTAEGEIGTTCAIAEPNLPAAANGYNYAANIVPSSIELLGATAIEVTNATVLDTDTMVTVTVTHTVDGEKDLSRYNDR
jgi:hypothetical protein